MIKYLIAWGLIITTYSCTNNKQTINRLSNFKTFEISYNQALGGSFSFIVDINKLYFYNDNLEYTYYGTLPDSIFASIDSLAFKLVNNKLYNIPDECYDCAKVAIQVITKVDTFSIKQFSYIDVQIWKMIGTLKKLKYYTPSSKLYGLTYFSTRNNITPMP